ncbi:iron-binding protein [Alphaproteobacteria bacterium GH1-50]|uniref:Iron-binding protein n=1 Tax=Kangsaoukella pontilimi TaxID=2691042 RepID=A0A7C9MG60_9RHOB|nr:CDGSH iron-sulfur domain-containing protein [Kangsaoukella pontilimi]MXQ08136.1 iron-binding protein [Kangsaoukella pontilimi]
MKPIETDDLTIRYDQRQCVHARECVLGLPKVFNTDARPWIQPEHGDTEEIVDVIEACPSGALSYVRKDGSEEPAPRVNRVRLWEDGPIEVHGDLTVNGEKRRRVLLCRCGKTANPPFCNNAHRKGFEATGLVAFDADSDEDLDDRSGPVEIIAQENGSYRITGRFEIIGSDGHRIARKTEAYLCRCGASGNKPFCDGSHKRLGFTKPSSRDETEA